MFTLMKHAMRFGWLDGLARGAYCLAASVVWDFAIIFMVLIFQFPWHYALLLHVVSILVGGFGAWGFFSADPAKDRSDRLATAGRVACVATAVLDLQLSAATAGAMFGIAPGMGLNRMRLPLWFFFASFATECAVLFLHASRVAMLVSDHSGKVQAKLLAVLAIAAIAGMATAITSPTPDLRALIIGGIFAAATSIWSVIFFILFGRRLSRESEQFDPFPQIPNVGRKPS
jgi:hypothetical protein